MNILLINPTHPSTPHISAVRAWRFATELSALGHCVVFLTATQQNDPETSIKSVANHDWTQPFVLACETGSREESDLPRFLHKMLTIWYMLSYGGRQRDWLFNAIQAIKDFEDFFVPDVIWTTFGKMEAVVAAKKIAINSKCPWIFDIKDNWELYVPPGLRHLMVWRTRGWSAIATNAKFTADKALMWQKTKATVIYSGVDVVFFTRNDIYTEQVFAINLLGGIYFAEHLKSFLGGIVIWLNQFSSGQRPKVKVRYLGGDTQRVSEVAKCYSELAIEIVGYVNTNVMAKYCQDADVNVYIAHSGTFHHKLLELLACGRPIMVIPKEKQESYDLVSQVAGVLIEVKDSEAVSLYLSELYQSWLSGSNQFPVSSELIRYYSWTNQTKLLEQVLIDVVSLATPEEKL